MSGYQTIQTETGVLVTVPSETEIPEVIESIEKTGTEHTRVQLILSQIGQAMGFKVPSLPSSLLTFDLQRKVSLLQKKGLESSPIRYRKIANFYCIGFPPSILFERSNSLS
jgi:hypothetical protein